jgi:hypothetical protein
VAKIKIQRDGKSERKETDETKKMVFYQQCFVALVRRVSGNGC